MTYSYQTRDRKAKRQATRDNAAIAFMYLAMMYFAARVAVGFYQMAGK